MATPWGAEFLSKRSIVRLSAEFCAKAQNSAVLLTSSWTRFIAILYWGMILLKLCEELR